jgi:hypothetical protein
MNIQPNIKSAKDAYWFAYYVINGRTVDAEPIIMIDPMSAYLYAYNIIKGRWVEGEPAIATDPLCAWYYACHIIKGRWLPGELTIMFSNYAIKYAKLCDF